MAMVIREVVVVVVMVMVIVAMVLEGKGNKVAKVKLSRHNH